MNNKMSIVMTWIFSLLPMTAWSSDYVQRSAADYIVNDRAGLVYRLGHAVPGDVIYIDDNAVIDLTGSRLSIEKEGVTLASGRSQQIDGKTGKGALLFTTDKNGAMLEIESNSVRITGIRFEGPTVAILDSGESEPYKPQSFISAVRTNKAPHPLEIDHCEFYAWTFAGVEIRGYISADKRAITKDKLNEIHIHENYFHHNRKLNRGYGVVVYDGYALIEKNAFDFNRHAIAAHGNPYSGYEARYNLVLEGADRYSYDEGHTFNYQQAFDMHRFAESGGSNSDTTQGPAGEYIHIYRNSFQYAKRYAFLLRGRPQDEALVEDNYFPHSRLIPDNESDHHVCAIKQNIDNYDEIYESYNFHYANNTLNGDSRNCTTIGDFDGDDKDDLFMTAGRTWEVALECSHPWQYLQNSSVLINDLAFGDFDGDRKMDVIRDKSAGYQISYSGSAPWKDMPGNPMIDDVFVSAIDLVTGDFDGDGKDDGFFAINGNWYVNYGLSGSWCKINESVIAAKDLQFGDMDGDGKTDIFCSSGGTWMVSWGGTSHWVIINQSACLPLRLVDYDGDGKSDIFYSTKAGAWKVCYSGRGPWQTVESNTGYTLDEIVFGDPDGDGVKDAIRKKGRSWFVHNRITNAWDLLNGEFNGDLPSLISITISKTI